MGVSQSHDDTIVAIASPHGPGVRGIVRLSGVQTVECVAKVFKADSGDALCDLVTADLVPGRAICDDLEVPGNLLVWPSEKSFTKQPSAEFHTFGSTSVLELVVSELCKQGARPAEPGEFTMRAFLSGRLDLTQAEAVLAVVDAKNRKQLEVAIDQLAGGVGTRLNETRNELVAALAELEAGLDFVEEDIEFISDSLLFQKLDQASDQLSSIVNQISGRHVTEEKFTAVLTGLPNAGKSSLFNCLLGESKAIVTNIAGTTTDYVTGELSQSGVTIQLIDTAGFEQIETSETASSQIQASAQDARQDRIERADLCIRCVAANAPVETWNGVGDLDFHVAPTSDADLQNRSASILVVTQSDRPLAPHAAARLAEIDSGSSESNQGQRIFRNVIRTSSLTSAGVVQLREMLFKIAIEAQTSDSPIVGSTLRRTADSLNGATKSIQMARQAASAGIGEELVAAEIRHALDHLGCVVGTVYTDDILDVVFGQFCIGK